MWLSGTGQDNCVNTFHLNFELAGGIEASKALQGAARCFVQPAGLLGILRNGSIKITKGHA